MFSQAGCDDGAGQGRFGIVRRTSPGTLLRRDENVLDSRTV